jgi:transcriptional regulator with XRE-family HTH domain
MIKKLQSKQDAETVGHRLKHIRADMKISQGELGDMIGVSYQQVGKYERGDNELSVSAMKRIAKALNISACDICGCGDG